MPTTDRIPWTTPDCSSVPELATDQVLALSVGDPWGHALAAAHFISTKPALPTLSHYRQKESAFVDGPLKGKSPTHVGPDTHALLPALRAKEGPLLCDDPLALAESLAPELFGNGVRTQTVDLRNTLLDPIYTLAHPDDQAAYERAHAQLAERLGGLDETLHQTRFLNGPKPCFADLLLFCVSIRLDPVYYDLHKATVGLLADFPALEGHARDLFERPALYTTTDFQVIKEHHYLDEPLLNPKKIIPKEGRPDLDAPHFRVHRFDTAPTDEAVEEDQERSRSAGEWVRPPSEERNWIRSDGEGMYPAEADRYHLYAPYNCPWSHRALLGRSVLGLEDVIGASIVYFRRDPERGWQFNPRIPGCTADLANEKDYVTELYEAVGSDETSVPLLWDTETDTIVSNESADILRMFATEFDDYATRSIDLYPVDYRREIERLNAAVYQRINNGAYKAGFADGQLAYERAYARYFRALQWLDGLLYQRSWLADSPAPTEADFRLFPTLFRHDAVYFTRFKLNQHRLAAYPHLSDWLDRMMEIPGIQAASNLDHARNGYFGRTGNEIVPAGPVPLRLSPRDFGRETWLNQG